MSETNRIFHVDGDSFFASCEIALDRKLEIVGGTEQDRADAHAWMKQFNIQSSPLTLRRAR